MKKNKSISCIRFFATLMVVILHISQQLERMTPCVHILTDWLNLGLVLFFCMSGYLYSGRINPKYDRNAPDYPVAILSGGESFKNLELHFLHYKNFEEANEKWELRKRRLHPDNLYVIWTFMGMHEDEKLYMRAQNLPIKNKVIFVNHPVSHETYPDFFT